MTTFLLDLWHDLREKRLWPVAVGLLAAAVAIPLVMLKPASSAAPVPVITAKLPTPETLPAVQVDSSPTHNSNLETFSKRNPFKPLSDLKKADASGNTPASKTSASGGQPASSGTPASSGSPSSRGKSSPSTGGTPSTSSTPSTPSAPSTPSGQPVKWFRYTADVRFGLTGKLKDMKGISPLALLPDDKTAAIVFMGVDTAGKTATFFISDPAFTPSGEGKCNDKSNCRFVKLTLDPKKNEEKFTSLDRSIVYQLKLVKINREPIPASQAPGKTAPAVPTPKVSGSTADDTISKASNAVLPRLLDLPAVAQQGK